MSGMVLRRVVKAPLMVSGIIQHALRRQPSPFGCSFFFLIYHRIDGGLPLELDLPPDLFQRQIAFLAATRRVASYDQALAQLETPAENRQPGFVLTFDDGYVDFYMRVFPLLRQYSLPAILFVTTGFVEDGTPYPMLSNPDADVHPVTWDMLGEMAESGLVTLGAHTHTHPVLVGAPRSRIEEELALPIELFERRLGLHPAHFAYPRAAVNAEVRSLTARYYASAVGGGGRPALSTGFDRYDIPRIPIRRSDGWQFFRAKLRGWLDNEELLYKRLRGLTGRKST